MKSELNYSDSGTRREKSDKQVATEIDLDETPELSTMLLTQRERKISRRLAIAKRNLSERMVVQKSVENFVLIKNINDITHS